MRKILFVLILLAFFSSCSNTSSFVGTKVTNEDGYSLEYSIFDKEEKTSLYLKKGDRLDVNVEQENGYVDIAIGRDGNRAIYEGKKLENFKFSLFIDNDGEYTISVIGHKAKGNVSFSIT